MAAAAISLVELTPLVDRQAPPRQADEYQGLPR
jgi:hypothetical protein